MEKQRVTLEFRWTTSRGRDTYDYNICSLWVNGGKATSCDGGGYDMEGTCLAEWIMDNFETRLHGLRANYGSNDDGTGFYGLAFHYRRNPDDTSTRLKDYTEGYKASLDGGCGINAIRRIAEE